MENKDLEWIVDVIEKLQVPQTHNERLRLTKILERVAPALIGVVDYTALQYFVSRDKDGMKDHGHTCNACGQDHFYMEKNPKHRETGADRDGNGGKPCRYEELLQLLKEEEQNEDK